MSSKTVPIEKHEELKEFFLKEIERRDKQIEKLKAENSAIMKSALKQSERNVKWTSYVEKLEKKLRISKDSKKS